jgi:hypothetical protein
LITIKLSHSRAVLITVFVIIIITITISVAIARGRYIHSQHRCLIVSDLDDVKETDVVIVAALNDY